MTIGDLRKMLAEVPPDLDDAPVRVYCFDCPECERNYSTEVTRGMRLGSEHGYIYPGAKTVLKFEGQEPRIFPADEAEA